ncbi:protein [Lentinula edodes]|uniref:Protein n=1 Tax=Lentinula edodes TaxID=5353 RepID=A0A1Q3EJY0_LENED|nr:protein [Lentinula edodes]
MMLPSRATVAYTLGQRLLKYHAGRLQVFAGPVGTTPNHQAISRPRFSTSAAAFAGNSEVKNGPNAAVEDRPLCREDFVHPDHEVPMADNIKESGVIPAGYSIDFVVSPERIISVLNQVGIKTIRQLPEETYYEMRATINDPSNLSIIPTRIYELKRQLQAQTDAESEGL